MRERARSRISELLTAGEGRAGGSVEGRERRRERRRKEREKERESAVRSQRMRAATIQPHHHFLCPRKGGTCCGGNAASAPGGSVLEFAQQSGHMCVTHSLTHLRGASVFTR